MNHALANTHMSLLKPQQSNQDCTTKALTHHMSVEESGAWVSKDMNGSFLLVLELT